MFQNPSAIPSVIYEGIAGSTTQVSGPVARYTSGAALNIGDVVYFSAANTVNKSATSADYQKFAGVVVGGRSTNGAVGNEARDVGVAACSASGQEVLVQYAGDAYVLSAAAITVATLLCVVTTSGAVDDHANATQGQIVGTALEAAAGAAVKIKMRIDHR